MQFGRGVAFIAGLAVVVIAAFLYFGVDRTESGTAKSGVAGTSETKKPEPFTPEKIANLEDRLESFREKSQEAERERAARRAAREAKAATGAATSPEAGSDRAAAEPAARAAGTRAGQARETRSKVADRAQVEALFSRGAQAPGAKAVAPSGESAPETPGESAPETPGKSAPESTPGKESVGSPVTMSCASDPWICNSFNLAVQLPGAIPVATGGTEAVYIPFSNAGGEVWIRTQEGVNRFSTPLLTGPSEVLGFLQRAGY